MVLNDLVDSFCYSQKNAGLKKLKTLIKTSFAKSFRTHWKNNY